MFKARVPFASAPFGLSIALLIVSLLAGVAYWAALFCGT
jgi:hypothetical protein